MNITFYSQRDSRWANQRISGDITFASSGCYIACIAMLASLAGYNDTPPQVLQKLQLAGVMSGALVANPGGIPDAYPGLCWCGRRNWLHPLTDEDLSWYIAQVARCPVITRVKSPVGDHFVLAIEVARDNVIIADPFDGKKRTLLPTYGAFSDGLKHHIRGVRMLKVEGLCYGK